MSAQLDIDIAGESLVLDADRAMFRPRDATLIVTDVHLGKGSALRRAGLAVASGSTRADLARLDVLLRRYSARRLLVLGDLFHAALATDEPWAADFIAFRNTHAAVDIEVVRGNHDRPAGVPADWRLRWHEAPKIEPPLVFLHEPAASSAGYALAGHVHPVVVLRTATERLRLPVFWFGANQGLLPSFGSFTGGYEIQPAAGDRVVATTPEQRLVDLSARFRRAH